jgi:hypothetical protein
MQYPKTTLQRSNERIPFTTRCDLIWIVAINHPRYHSNTIAIPKLFQRTITLTSSRRWILRLTQERTTRHQIPQHIKMFANSSSYNIQNNAAYNVQRAPPPTSTSLDLVSDQYGYFLPAGIDLNLFNGSHELITPLVVIWRA